MKTVILVLSLITVGWSAGAGAADSCDLPGLGVSLEGMGQEALQQRVEMLEAQARSLRSQSGGSLLLSQEELQGGAVSTGSCVEELEYAAMEARVELLRNYLDSTRANAR